MLQNLTFLFTQCPWILANFTFAQRIRTSIGLGDNDVRMAIYFCFAAVFLAIGSWLTLGVGVKEGREPDEAADDVFNDGKRG